jgi:hypothetical protein
MLSKKSRESHTVDHEHFILFLGADEPDLAYLILNDKRTDNFKKA